MHIAIQLFVSLLVAVSLASPAQSQITDTFAIEGVDTPITITKDSPLQNPYGRLNPFLPEDFLPSSHIEKIETRLIVVYKSDPTRSERLNLLNPLGVESKEKVGLANSLTLDIVEFESKSEAANALRTLRQSPLVESVNRDVLYHITAVPNDPDYSKTWGMQQMNVPTAWNTTTGSSEIVVGVIDTGIDLDHPDLVDNLWVNEDEIPNNGIDDDNNGYIDDIHGWDFVGTYNEESGQFEDDNVPNDDVIPGVWASGHGTHVAGTIAGVGNNGIGVAGVAWQAKLMALRICSYGCSLSDHVLALEYAYDNGAQIVNESFGGGYDGYDWERNAIAAVAEPGTGEQKGILVVAAGGNNGANTEVSQFHPANYRLENHISVAATESNGSLAGFSNYSTTNIDVAAPGSGIWSTLPEGAFNTTGGYGYLSGTSMAAPHVAGVAVLIQASHPTWKPSDIRKALIATVQPSEALASKVFSGGIVDAAAAVALNVVPEPKLLLRQIGTGTGSVTGGGLECDDSVCLIDNTGSFTFTATAHTGSTFQGWSGFCTSETLTCTIESNHVSPVVSVKFSQPSNQNISVELLESSPSTPAFTDWAAPNYVNVTNSKLSADGTVRAKAVWRSSYWCYFRDADTGGITIERKVDGQWIEEAKFTAPSLDETRDVGSFANCNLFGREMHLSDDGNTLVVLLGTYVSVNFENPDNDYILCGAAAYRKQNDGSWSEPSLLTPSDRYDCIKIESRTETSMSYWNGFRSLTMSDDGNTVFVTSADKVIRFNITNLNNIQDEVISFPNNCIALTSSWNQWFNISTDYSATTLVVPTGGCSNGAETLVISMAASNSFTYLPASPWSNAYVAKTAISEDGTLIALSYREQERGVQIFQKVGNTWTLRSDLNTIEGFEGYVNCSKFSDDNTTLLCDGQFSDVGRNAQQGKALIYTSENSSWTGFIHQEQYWATLGSPFDWASITTATDDALVFDMNISGNSLGINYEYNIMGSTFDIATAPAFLASPRIEGVPSVGGTLSVANVRVQGVSQSSLTYQWYQCNQMISTSPNSLPISCSAISGATMSQYIMNSNVLNKFILLGVTASNGKGSESVFTASTAQVKNTAVLKVPPTISGSALVNQTLRTTNGTWTSLGRLKYTYQWKRCNTDEITSCSQISRATKNTYKLTTSDIDKFITVEVKATNSAGMVSAHAQTTVQVGSLPQLTGTIRLNSASRVTQTLTATGISWQGSPSPSVYYQWLRCSSQVRKQVTIEPRGCAIINGAIDPSYVIQSADVGKYLVMRTHGTNMHGTSAVWSKSTSKIVR